MVATTGARLLPEAAVKTLCKNLLPQTFLLTPNIPEANLIIKESGRSPVEVHDLEGLKRLAASLHELGVKYVLLKGGHVPLTSDHQVAKTSDSREIVVNVLHGEGVCQVIESAYQDSKNTHGTGCSLASAIACNLAFGQQISTAVRAACRYVDAGIRSSPGLGKGNGPLNHFHSLQTLPFAPGNFIDYVLEREDVKPAWHEYTHHDFVGRMGDGTLPEQAFKHYMIQDYLYLIHFARANALAGYKTKSLDDIAGAATIVTHIRHEINLHINECKQFGLTQEEMEKHDESQACTAYSRYVLDIGASEDWLALQISLLPCLLGYGMIAARLKSAQKANPPKEPNRYQTWIDNYVAEDYVQAVETGRGEHCLSRRADVAMLTGSVALIEKHAAKQSPTRIEELVKIFIHATKVSAHASHGDAVLPARELEASIQTNISIDGDRVLGHGERIRMRSSHMQRCFWIRQSRLL